MDFADLFTTGGRANRLWYFWHIVLDDFVILGLIVATLVVSLVLDTPLLIIPLVGAILGGIWAGIAITVKRLHDLDRPGWHWLLLAVPFYNIYLGLVLLFARGTWGPNRFGPDPLAYDDGSRYLEGG